MYKLSLIEWRNKDIMLKIGVFLFCFDRGGFIINLNRPYYFMNHKLLELFRG